MEPVVTGRLVVRGMAETDLGDYLAFHTHPAVRGAGAEPMTEAGARRVLGRQAEVETGDGGGYLPLMVERRDTGRVIGEVSVFLEPRAQSQGDIGWIIHPDSQGRGYASEAAAILLSYAFLTRGLHRVTARCETRNTASWRLMERLGMRREGHLQQSLFADDAWRDEYLYALLRDEYLYALLRDEWASPQGV